MTTDDPFALPPDPDRTVLIPTPGSGQRAPVDLPDPLRPLNPVPGLAQAGAAPVPANGIAPSQAQQAAANMAPPTAPAQPLTPARQPAASMPVVHSGLNPLTKAASPLLALVAPLRQLPAHGNVEALRVQLIQAVNQFEEQARAAGYDADTVAASRYALCTLVDESIAGTPWGGNVWGRQSLLVHFHNEASGGEKFFLILQRMAQNPKENLAALELFYLCMSVGLQGRYRLANDGAAQLASLRERLARLIADHREPVEPELSPHWRGIAKASASLARVVPLWVYAAVAAVALGILHLLFSYDLNSYSDDVFNDLHGVKIAQLTPLRPAGGAPKRVQPVAPAAPGLATFLAPEIERKLVSVQDSAGRTMISIVGQGLFASGSTRVQKSYAPLLERIGQALAQTRGRVIVVGHTDNVRMISSRFPSNWHLSRARAQAVLNIIAPGSGAPTRFRAEGRGAAEPLVPNTNRQNRARNRRVEILIDPARQL